MPRIALVCLQILLFLLNALPVSGQVQLYPVNDLKADLRYLKTALEKTHPALFSYTPRPAFDAFIDSIYHSIAQPMDEQAFFSLITLIHARIGDGHTMFLPSEATTSYNNSKGKFLPFTVNYIGGKLYVIENCSGDTSIERGEEIVSINGEATAVVMSRLLERQIRDGYNQTYPVWILNHYFPSYYSFTYGQPPQFKLELRNNKNETYRKEVAALTKDSIRLLRQIRYAANDHPGITLEEHRDSATAILTIKSFDADLLGSLYKGGYKPLIDSVFAVLKHNRTKDLILDLRDNQGGDFEPGRYLLSYLLNEPAQYLLAGEESRLIRPKPNHFTGKLFVLVNGGSFSNTAIVSACLERAKRAVFIGEETGGNTHIISGNATEIQLPKTHIRGFISTTTYKITPGTNDGHGLVPTHYMLPAIADVLNGRDIVKAFVLKLCASPDRPGETISSGADVRPGGQ